MDKIDKIVHTREQSETSSRILQVEELGGEE